MDQTIQRRVADAKKADIHPLFALGASAGASPTTSVSGGSPAGGTLAAGVGKLSQALMQASIEEKSGQRQLNEAQAAYYNALAAKAEQDGAARGRDGVSHSLDPVDTGPDVVYGPPEFVAPEVALSKRPGVESGTHPSRREFKDAYGQTYEGFAPSAQMDEVGQLEYLLGLPSRMFSVIRKDYRNQRDILNMERDLKTLKRMKSQGVTYQEAEAFRQEVYRKARALRAKLLGWYKRYRKLYE